MIELYLRFLYQILWFLKSVVLPHPEYLQLPLRNGRLLNTLGIKVAFSKLKQHTNIQIEALRLRSSTWGAATFNTHESDNQ